jgi:hypothetical protein
MALMDLCLHDSVKLRHPTCGESVQPLKSVKFIWIAMSGLERVMVWFQQLSGLGRVKT